MKEQVAIEKRVNKELEQATDYKCKSKADYEHGSNLLKILKEAEKKSAALKDKVLKPLLEATKEHRATFKPFEIGVAACLKHVKEEMDRFREEEERKIEREKVRVANDGRLREDTVERKIEELSGTLSFSNTRKTRELNVIDINKIPREYFDLNESKVKAALMEGTDVPGAELVLKVKTVA